MHKDQLCDEFKNLITLCYCLLLMHAYTRIGPLGHGSDETMELGSDGQVEPVELEPVVDAEQLRGAFGCFASGVTAVCAEVSGRPVGMLVSSFTSVSLEPSLVSICVGEASRTWTKLHASPHLGISVLGDGNRSVCQRFSSADDRFLDVRFATTTAGAILLADASAWFDCSIVDEVAAGDHTIVILQVHALHARPATPPLVFHGSEFHRLSAGRQLARDER